MKFIFSFFILLITNTCFAQKSTKDFYSIKIKGIDNKEINLKKYKGKKILIVNVASKCGYTYQYTDLEKLYQKNKKKLVVLGVPSNDFGRQEPGTNSEIGSFCKKNYDVSFPMTTKVKVIGDSNHELYKWLGNSALNGWNNNKPKWNFYKYLINEEGQLIQLFPSKTEPLSKEIEVLINK